MSVTPDDVRRVAAFARLAVDDDRARALAAELSAILDHMAVLSRVTTDGVEEMTGAGLPGLPLRADAGPPAPMTRAIAEIAPRTQDGFFLVPRLSTHEDAAESSS